MDKEPKKPGEQNGEQQDKQDVMVECLPLTVLVSGIINSADVFNFVFRAAQIFVVFILTYQIIGKPLFVAFVLTPLLVAIIERSIEAYDLITSGDDWDDMDDDSDDDNDPHFGDHFNNNLKG